MPCSHLLLQLRRRAVHHRAEDLRGDRAEPDNSTSYTRVPSMCTTYFSFQYVYIYIYIYIYMRVHGMEGLQGEIFPHEKEHVAMSPGYHPVGARFRGFWCSSEPGTKKSSEPGKTCSFWN